MANINDQVVELEELQKQIDARKATLRKDAIAEAQRIIDQFDLTSSEFRFRDIEAARKAKRAPVLPKYKGPNGELWTGRGRTPKWAEKVMNEGGNIADYLINK